MSGERRYSAFISYSHADADAARRLQRELETYRLPRALRTAPLALRDVEGAVAPRTGRLLPVFRDRDDLTAAPDLPAAVQEALAASAALIVVCTPAAARSEWVAREIALARSLGKPVLTALSAGEAAAAFPPGLVTGDGHNPLAADFRPGGDGRRLALLKLVAALAHVPLDALIQRDAQRRLRRALAAAAAAALVVAAVAGVAALWLFARADARAEQARGVATVAGLVDQRQRFATAGRLDLLQALDRTALAFFRDRDVRSLPVAAQLLSAKLLQGVAEDDEAAGDLDGLAEASAAAWATTRRLLDAKPGDEERAMAHAQSAYWAGLAGWRRGDMTAARRHFIGYAALADRLAASSPRHADRQREAGEADSNLASFALRAGDLATAARGFRAAQARFQAAARLAPDDQSVQADLADGEGWLADVERLSGRLNAAWNFRQAQRSTLHAMLGRDPGNAVVEASLIKNQLGLARVAALSGRGAQADSLFDAGRAAALARARSDRSNASITRQARAFDLFQALSWLDRPSRERPPLTSLITLLSNCAPEREHASGDEAAALCALARARALALTGHTATARELITAMPCTAGYSERWRLDFCAEQTRALSAIEPVGGQGER